MELLESLYYEIRFGFSKEFNQNVEIPTRAKITSSMNAFGFVVFMVFGVFLFLTCEIVAKIGCHNRNIDPVLEQISWIMTGVGFLFFILGLVFFPRNGRMDTSIEKFELSRRPMS